VQFHIAEKLPLNWGGGLYVYFTMIKGDFTSVLQKKVKKVASGIEIKRLNPHREREKVTEINYDECYRRSG